MKGVCWLGTWVVVWVLSAAPRVHADEKLLELPLAPVLANLNRGAHGMLYHLPSMPPPPPLEPEYTELRLRAKEPRRAEHPEIACRAALSDVLEGLHSQASELGRDAIVGITSIWRNKRPSAPGLYTCAVGLTSVSVELKGYAQRTKKAAAAASKAQAGAPADDVRKTSDERGVTYAVVLGNATVGVKLQATPDQDRERVHIAVAFAAPDGAPHEGCALGAKVGEELLPMEATRYERRGAQETLFGALPLAQLARLAADDGALTACETRIEVRSASRAKIRALLDALKEHSKPAGPVQRGDVLSL